MNGFITHGIFPQKFPTCQFPLQAALSLDAENPICLNLKGWFQAEKTQQLVETLGLVLTLETMVLPTHVGWNQVGMEIKFHSVYL